MNNETIQESNKPTSKQTVEINRRRLNLMLRIRGIDDAEIESIGKILDGIQSACFRAGKRRGYVQAINDLGDFMEAVYINREQ